MVDAEMIHIKKAFDWVEECPYESCSNTHGRCYECELDDMIKARINDEKRNFLDV